MASVRSIRIIAVRLFLPAPAAFGLLISAAVATSSPPARAVQFAAFILLALGVLCPWLAVSAPAAASLAARSILAGAAYGFVGLLVAAGAFAAMWSIALDDCSIHRCFLPTLGWTIFYCWFIFVVCGVLFSGAARNV